MDTSIISKHQKKTSNTLTNIALGAILTGGFLALIAWFDIVDVYHQHFFDHGAIIFAYNVFRVLFVFYAIWIIYVSGYAIIALAVPHTIRQHFSLSERIILGFGTGVGIWHVLMLVLGLYNLYYQSVMVALCTLILCTSTTHFRNTLHQIRFSNPSSMSLLTGLLVGTSLIWLLLVRGLFPGGGGDYFTHYFYYYMNVVHNHGLAPNDVWYHYYYSKGAGLYFLGILLTDPEAPELITFCCVSIATIALTNLVSRLSPQRTLWPSFCALLYVLYNLVALSGGGGEFQKTHEETTALVIIATWAICLYDLHPQIWKRASFVLLTSAMIGAAIVTQAIAVYFAIVFAVQAGLSLFKKNWQRMWFYGSLGAITTAAVCGIFLLNYLVTGLLTDQAINLTWRLANLDRLNQWGVIPNVMMVAWIRDNYEHVATSWGINAITQLLNFMRADVLRIMLIATVIAAISYRFIYHKSHTVPGKRSALINVGLITGVFTVLSLFAGHDQAVSYFRFSSFFFPLLTLLCVIFWSSYISRSQFSRITAPLILFAATLLSWPQWRHHAHHVTTPAVYLMTGRYSLADAYAHQHVGLPFGGINPGTYAAVQHIPPRARIWSTNVDSYCMAPDCQVESVISFKLSSNLNTILNDTPKKAKETLQREKLNYFLFSKDSLLLDLLPFSRLFDPAIIKDYLAIKWTDGHTYLLTWHGPDTTPIDAEFLTAYNERIANSQHPWFRFNEAIPQMNATMSLIEHQPHPWKPIVFPWRKINNGLLSSGINILSSDYGTMYSFKKTSPYLCIAAKNNTTHQVKNLCQGKPFCTFKITPALFGTLANNCRTNFNVTYLCPEQRGRINISLAKNATGKKILINCTNPSI